MDSPNASPQPSKFTPTLMIFLALPVLGIVAAILLIASNNVPNAASGEPTPEPVRLPGAVDVINAPMLDFELNTLSGQTVSLSDFQGRIVFLNFWATWCGPCERELPALQAFAREQIQKPDGAVVLAVNMQEGAEDVQRFLDARDITSLLILMDETGDVSDLYGIFNLPVTFVIDRNGVVRYPKYGEITITDLNAYVAELNKEA